MGRRTLPPPPEGSGAFARSLRRAVTELAHSGARRLPRGAHPPPAERARRRRCSASTPAAPTRSAPTSRAAATSTSPRSPPARSRPRRSRRSSSACATRRSPAPRAGSSSSSTRSPPRAPAAASRASSSTSTPAPTWASASTRSRARSRASGSRSTARSCATHGVALAGPPPADLFAPIPRSHAAPAAAGVDPLAPRQRRPARLRHRAQHLPRAALRDRGDVVVQARGGRLGRRSSRSCARRSPARSSTAAPWCDSSTATTA